MILNIMTIDLIKWYTKEEELRNDYLSLNEKNNLADIEQELETSFKKIVLRHISKIYERRSALVKLKKDYLVLWDNTYKVIIDFEKEIRTARQGPNSIAKNDEIQIEKIHRALEYINDLINYKINNTEHLLFITTIIIEKINYKKSFQYFIWGIIFALITGIIGSAIYNFIF